MFLLLMKICINWMSFIPMFMVLFQLIRYLEFTHFIVTMKVLFHYLKISSYNKASA